jgi:hypothetical protein
MEQLKLAPLFVAFFVLCSCSLMPSNDLNKAEALVPQAKECAIKSIENLTADEHKFISQNNPIISHSNYVDYYYWWRSVGGKTLFTVQSGPPSEKLEPCRAYRNESESY